MGFLKAGLKLSRGTLKLSRLAKQPEKHYKPKPPGHDAALSGASRPDILAPCRIKL
jgi:hypothetical protein